MKTYEQALNLAHDALRRQDFKRALDIADTVLSGQIDDVPSLIAAGIALSEMGHVGTSVALFSYAGTLAPQVPEIWANLGASLRRAGQTDLARASLKRALELSPNDPTALCGMAGTYVNDGNPAVGEAWGKKALASDGSLQVNRNNLALCLLEQGKWAEAWPHWRHRTFSKNRAEPYPGKRWEGEQVESLAIHGEQGLGDEIMLLGCLPQLMLRVNGRLVIECAPRLAGLVARAFPHANVIGSRDQMVGETEAWVAMGDLPELCVDSKPPRTSGYFVADPLEGYANTVLIAFKGGTRGTHEHLRNPPRAAWAPVVDAIRSAGYRPLSIQYGQNAAEMADDLGIEHDAPVADDLMLQARAISSCRALVSVQQTALHLGGALGVDVLGVVSSKPAWRYGMSGSMPWYASITLFRQLREEDWSPVMWRVARGVLMLREKVAA